MIDVETWFNLFEAVLWIVVAAIMSWHSRKQPPQIKNLGFATAAFFFIFGISDFIEMRTGAWWSPRWLLVMKGSCITAFIISGIRYRYLKTFHAKP